MTVHSHPKSWRDFDRIAGYRHIEVLPLNGAVVAEVRGVDLTKPIDDSVWKEIERAFAENLVIYFRDQHGFTRDHHLAFSQRFGPLQKIPHIFSVDGYPDVQIVERLVDDKRMVVGEGFHNDSTFMRTPPTTVTMHAIDVPDYGGDTAFSNLYLAYETLSPAMRAFAETLIGVNSAKVLFGAGADQSRVMMKKMDTAEGDAEVEHPIVCVHPRTGLKHLFLNLVYTRTLKGFSEKESRLILDFFHNHITSMAFTGRARWQKGTVLIWDNWAAHHSAIADYQGKYRYMERVTTGGVTLRGVQ
ncbi:MAG: TauD/TfdA family dioxygenase [Parvularculaceae bacterium]